MSESDESLMVRVGEGDLKSFHALVRRYEAAARRYCYRIFRDGQTAEDLAQEVFLKLYVKADLYKPTGPFKTYFYRVLGNHCFDRLRYDKRRVAVRGTTVSGQVLDGMEEGGGATGNNGRFVSPEKALMHKEEAATVRKAVRSLPENLQRAIVLREFEGLKYREIAEVMSVSLNEVKVLIHRGRQQLAKRLKRMLSGERRP